MFLGISRLSVFPVRLHTAGVAGSIPAAPTIFLLKHLLNSSPRKSLGSQLHANGPEWTEKDSVTAH